MGKMLLVLLGFSIMLSCQERLYTVCHSGLDPRAIDILKTAKVSPQNTIFSQGKYMLSSIYLLSYS